MGTKWPLARQPAAAGTSAMQYSMVLFMQNFGVNFPMILLTENLTFGYKLKSIILNLLKVWASKNISEQRPELVNTKHSIFLLQPFAIFIYFGKIWFKIKIKMIPQNQFEPIFRGPRVAKKKNRFVIASSGFRPKIICTGAGSHKVQSVLCCY